MDRLTIGQKVFILNTKNLIVECWRIEKYFGTDEEIYNLARGDRKLARPRCGIYITKADADEALAEYKNFLK